MSRALLTVPAPALPSARLPSLQALCNGVQPVAVKVLNTPPDLQQVIQLGCRRQRWACVPTPGCSSRACSSSLDTHPRRLLCPCSHATQARMDDFRREVAILKSCRDVNIVQFVVS